MELKQAMTGCSQPCRAGIKGKFTEASSARHSSLPLAHDLAKLVKLPNMQTSAL